METYIGTIMLFGFDFAPVGWAKCEGQLLPVAQYSTLFSLLKTTYGGDGINTFALPDLRGRVPLGAGQGPGLSRHVQGEEAGSESVSLMVSNLPAHSHALMASVEPGNSSNPSGNVLAGTGATDQEYTSAAPNTTMSTRAIGATGGNMPVPNMQPYLTLNYCIALYGIFPSQS